MDCQVQTILMTLILIISLLHIFYIDPITTSAELLSTFFFIITIFCITSLERWCTIK